MTGVQTCALPIYGKAGDIAAEEKGEYGMIAGDIVRSLPYAIKEICDG